MPDSYVNLFHKFHQRSISDWRTLIADYNYHTYITRLQYQATKNVAAPLPNQCADTQHCESRWRSTLLVSTSTGVYIEGTVCYAIRSPGDDYWGQYYLHGGNTFLGTFHHCKIQKLYHKHTNVNTKTRTKMIAVCIALHLMIIR